MGQKVNPIGLRTALTRNWESRWFAGKALFGKWLHEDLKIRKFIKEKFAAAAIARIQIERFASRVRITIFAARPGMLIGKKGAELDVLRQDVMKMVEGKDIRDIAVDVNEIKRAETNAQLVAENVAMQLERRIGFRRAMKRAIQQAMDMGVDGHRRYGRLCCRLLSPRHPLRPTADHASVRRGLLRGRKNRHRSQGR